MDNVTYKVSFEGDLLPGCDQDTVQQRLAELFRIDMSVASKLFTGKQRDLKRGISLNHAKKYVRAMSKLGALAFIMPYITEEDNTNHTIVLALEDDMVNHTLSKTEVPGGGDCWAFNGYK